jgi:hypothetical protein
MKKKVHKIVMDEREARQEEVANPPKVCIDSKSTWTIYLGEMLD